MTNYDAVIDYLDQAMAALSRAQEEIDKNDPDLLFTRRMIGTAHTMSDSNRLMVMLTKTGNGKTQPAGFYLNKTTER